MSGCVGRRNGSWIFIGRGLLGVVIGGLYLIQPKIPGTDLVWKKGTLTSVVWGDGAEEMGWLC